MRRRDLIALIGLTTAFRPLAAMAQAKLPTIGYFSTRSPEAEVPIQAPFLKRLEDAGFIVGRNVAIEYRFAEGQLDRLPLLAAELAGRQPAVLVATEPAAALAAKAVSVTIPIVFTSGQDPVRLGLVASLSRPAGNATGMSLFTSELGPKRLGLLREILPKPGIVAFVVDPKSLTAPAQIKELKAAAQAIDQPILVLEARSDDEIEKAFATMAERRVSGLFYGTSTFFQVIADQLVALAALHRIPALYEWREFVAAGGLMSYSTSRTEVGLQLGDYVARILKGATPAELPVVQSTRFEFVINLKTAKALGLTLPQSLLARADEVFE
ncbi:MAG: ABC transporter substrate-binding protein [Proteobacteria bacterium]|nr:ABC transporter substrate-binding protein [Pseudomonadota bacterium]